MTEKMATLTSNSMRVNPGAPSPRFIHLLASEVRHDRDGSRPAPVLPRHGDSGFAQPRLAEVGGVDFPAEVSVLLGETARRAAGHDRALRPQFPEPRLDQRQPPGVLGGVA